ncbi:MAG TPA: DUF5777 family beta-barrel protein [Bacteroidales bacterium]|nr:DUF5777 family beta-barrel protein [Bacteroidales bacterium]HPS62100.1 DUF5777 family beta-barrel protein [Bacteroidales bacterium]
MKQVRILFLIMGVVLASGIARGQDELLSMFDTPGKSSVDYTTATFKMTRVVIGQSAELAPQGNLFFVISHHFGALNTGYNNLFGLKQASIRLGLDLGITRWMSVGIGLNTDRTTWDGFLKFKVLRQSKGGKVMPVTLDVLAGTAARTDKVSLPGKDFQFSHRLNYNLEVLVARKFSNSLSFQLMPSYIHKNLVPKPEDKNNIFTLGAGGRVKLSQRVSVNAEYHHLFSGQVVSEKAYDSFSVGVDIETGGHVFQVFLTNSAGMHESSFLTETAGKWSNGEIFLGFNISRIFTLWEK